MLLLSLYTVCLNICLCCSYTQCVWVYAYVVAIHNVFEYKFILYCNLCAGSLWVCVVLNPQSTSAERQHWRELLTSWSQCSVCPLEDGDSHLGSDLTINHGQIRQHRSGASSSSSQRTVFHHALEASTLSWNDKHLQSILKQSSWSLPPSSSMSPSKRELFDSNNLPLWNGEWVLRCNYSLFCCLWFVVGVGVLIWVSPSCAVLCAVCSLWLLVTGLWIICSVCIKATQPKVLR